MRGKRGASQAAGGAPGSPLEKKGECSALATLLRAPELPHDLVGPADPQPTPMVALWLAAGVSVVGLPPHGGSVEKQSGARGPGIGAHTRAPLADFLSSLLLSWLLL